MNKFKLNKNLIIGIFVALIIVISGFLIISKKEIIEDSEVIVDNQDEIDTSDWQTKKASLFTISFPKDWYWIEDEDNENIFVISNNSDFDVSRARRDVSYQDMNMNDSDIVIRFGGTATSNSFPAEELKPEVDYIKLAIEDGMEFVLDNYGDVCGFIKDTQDLDIAKCKFLYGENMLINEYFIGNISSVIVMSVCLGEKAVFNEVVLDEIAKSVIVKKLSN